MTSENLGGHVTLATPPFRKFLRGMSGLSMETCLSVFKSVSLTVLEQLNARKFRGSHDPGHGPFSKKNLRGHVQTVPVKMLVKFEVPSFESALHLYALGVKPR